MNITTLQSIFHRKEVDDERSVMIFPCWNCIISSAQNKPNLHYSSWRSFLEQRLGIEYKRNLGHYI